MASCKRNPRRRSNSIPAPNPLPASGRGKPRARRKEEKPAPPSHIWRKREISRRQLVQSLRAVGAELKRRGEDFGKPERKTRPLDPILAALKQSRELAGLIGALRTDGKFDEATLCWAELPQAGPIAKHAGGQRTLSLFTRLGRERAQEMGAAAQSALRNAGWRALGAGATVGQAPGKASGVWTANLSLVPLPARAPQRVSMAR